MYKYSCLVYCQKVHFLTDVKMPKHLLITNIPHSIGFLFLYRFKKQVKKESPTTNKHSRHHLLLHFEELQALSPSFVCFSVANYNILYPNTRIAQAIVLSIYL